MDSVFIRKSYVGRGAYKAASKLTRAERDVIRNNLAERKSGRSIANSPFLPPSLKKVMKPGNFHRSLGLSPETDRADRALSAYRGMKLSENDGVRTSPFHRKKAIMNPLYGGAASITGSKRNPTKVLHQRRGRISHRSIEHEMEHLRPQRSGWRLAEIMTDSKKLGGEEARADWFSGGARTDKLRIGETAYAKLSRKRAKDGTSFNNNTLANQMLGGDADDFLDTYNKTQSKFKAKNIKFGQNAQKNAEYAEKNYGIKRRPLWDKVKYKVDSHPRVVGGVAATGVGAVGYGSHRSNNKKVKSAPQVRY